MKPLSTRALKMYQGMNSQMYQDDCEINPEQDIDDGYGVVHKGYPSSGYVVKGSLQPVVRIPGTPEAGATSLVVGNFLIKLPKGTKLPHKSRQMQIVVNGNGVYQAMNVYEDARDAPSISVYCDRIQ